MNPFWQMPSALRETVQSLLQSLDRRDGPRQKDDEPDEDAIALLEDSEREAPPIQKQPLPPRVEKSTSRKNYIVVIGIAALFIGLIAIFHSRSASSQGTAATEQATFNDLKETRYNDYFHVLIPGTSDSSADFCKTIVSGAVLNYPTPWAIVYDTTNATRTAFSKIERVSAWMNRMPEQNDPDLVAVIGNARSSWFQVRPEVLIQRYLDIRRKEEHRLDDLFPSTTATRAQQYPKSRIVFSSEPVCALEDSSQCLEVPAPDGSVQFLSTDIAIGPLRDLRELWRQATSVANQTILANRVVHEHGVFTGLLRRQTAHRESIDHFPSVSAAGNLHFNERNEFGITLDFHRELSYAADDKLEGVSWLEPSDERFALLKLPPDIADSQPPFWSYNKSLELPLEKNWSHVSLLTDVRSNVIPAVIHRGPRAAFNLTTSWWAQMWFHPHARKLLDNFAATPMDPIALVTGEDGRSRRFWSPIRERVGLKTANGVFHEFDGICGGGEDWREIFLDDLGRWQDPSP
ncbi:Hypothetical predicted protein [Lecanosticta acicola]|uniref:Uncharacterized protein n=1 Tax=Lecanosticta acicola TaxID=111012 RepID=A0AAI9EAE2_9PEZI|nr:Hypothetical predicted protein [Lecanosticta acicola]